MTLALTISSVLRLTVDSGSLGSTRQMSSTEFPFVDGDDAGIRFVGAAIIFNSHASCRRTLNMQRDKADRIDPFTICSLPFSHDGMPGFARRRLIRSLDTTVRGYQYSISRITVKRGG